MFPSALTYYSVSEAANFVINNNATQPQLWRTTPFYYIEVTSVEGLFSADISYESHPIPNFIGEKSGDVFRRGKTITISGNVTGLNLSKLYTGIEYLQQMFTETGLRKLKWTRWSDAIPVYIYCRISQDLAVVENIDSPIPKMGYTVALRADDPRSRKFSDNTVYPTFQA